MGGDQPDRRVRYQLLLTLVIGLAVTGALLYFGWPRDYETLEWGGHQVSADDLCIGYISGVRHSDQCGDVATVTGISRQGNWVLLGPSFLGVLAAGLALFNAGENTRKYKIENGTVRDIRTVEAIAAMHELGGVRDVFAGSRGAFVATTALSFACCEAGVVVGEPEMKLRAYRWDEIVSVLNYVTAHYENSWYQKTTFTCRMEFADGTVLPLRGTHRVAPGADGAAADSAAYRFTAIADAMARVVAIALLPRSLDALAAGKALCFGPLVIDANGLRFGRRDAPWSQVGAAVVKSGGLTVPYQGRRGSIVPSRSVAIYPNLPLMLMLIEILRAGDLDGRAR